MNELIAIYLCLLIAKTILQPGLTMHYQFPLKSPFTFGSGGRHFEKPLNSLPRETFQSGSISGFSKHK